jgi:hypothetical protein
MIEEQFRKKIMAIHENLWVDLPEKYRQWGTGRTLSELTDAVSSASSCDIENTIKAVLRYDRSVNNLVPLLPLEYQKPVSELYEEALKLATDEIVTAFGKKCASQG